MINVFESKFFNIFHLTFFYNFILSIRECNVKDVLSTIYLYYIQFQLLIGLVNTFFSLVFMKTSLSKFLRIICYIMVTLIKKSSKKQVLASYIKRFHWLRLPWPVYLVYLLKPWPNSNTLKTFTYKIYIRRQMWQLSWCTMLFY